MMTTNLHLPRYSEAQDYAIAAECSSGYENHVLTLREGDEANTVRVFIGTVEQADALLNAALKLQENMSIELAQTAR